MRLKLIQGLSYTGIISATRKNPFVEVDEATAEELVASGYFEAVDGSFIPFAETIESEPETAAETEFDSLQYGGKLLVDMNKSELETFAAYKDVDIKGAKSKNDIIRKLRAALPAEELEGKIYYGSPTMVELQEEIK